MDHTTKIKRAKKLAKLFPGAEDEVLKLIPNSLINSLSSKQIASVMQLLNINYHRGKNSTGATVIDPDKNDGSVWVECLDGAIEWKVISAKQQITEQIDQHTKRTSWKNLEPIQYEFTLVTAED